MNLPRIFPRLRIDIIPTWANIKDEMHALTWLYTNIPDYNGIFLSISNTLHVTTAVRCCLSIHMVCYEEGPKWYG